MQSRSQFKDIASESVAILAIPALMLGKRPFHLIIENHFNRIRSRRDQPLRGTIIKSESEPRLGAD